jgi:hypothetical protein
MSLLPWPHYITRRGCDESRYSTCEEDGRNVEDESGREFVNKLIVRNLLWTLAISVALTAILVAVVFLGAGYPLRVLVVMGILVPAMAAIVTFLTLQSGKNRGAGGGIVDYPERTNYPRRTNYSGPTYYPVWISEGGGEDSGGGGDFNVEEFGGETSATEILAWKMSAEVIPAGEATSAEAFIQPRPDPLGRLGP